MVDAGCANGRWVGASAGVAEGVGLQVIPPGTPSTFSEGAWSPMGCFSRS